MKTLKIIASWLLVAGIIALIFIRLLPVFTSPLPPIRFSHIPKETIDFINKVRDQIIVINRNPKSGDWNNDSAGNGYLAEYKSLQDTSFIVYYLPRTEAEFRAVEILKQANGAIKPLEDMFGKYYYPYLVNKRKLPIFITNSDREYNNIIQQVGHCDGRGSVGITCFELSQCGIRTLGIFLSPQAWEGQVPDFSRIVLRHEMSHYVFLTSLDFEKNPSPLCWVIEGTAEYFAEDVQRLKDVNKLKAQQIHLDRELDNHLDNYWVGYTVLLGAENHYGKKVATRFIRENYYSPIASSVYNSFRKGMPSFQTDWQQYVNSLP